MATRYRVSLLGKNRPRSLYTGPTPIAVDVHADGTVDVIFDEAKPSRGWRGGAAFEHFSLSFLDLLDEDGERLTRVPW